MWKRTWVLLACVGPWPAWGQPQPVAATRRDLINETEQAHSDGDHARALDRARRAGRVRMSPSLRALIAREEEDLGHTIEAFREAATCTRELEANPSEDYRGQFLRLCRELERSLTPRVGQIIVRVEGNVPGARVRIAGRELSQEEWGAAQVYLPGSLRVVAEAPGRVQFDAQIHLEGGEIEPLTVSLPPVPRPRIAPRSTPGAGPWVVMGVGAACFAASGFLFLETGEAVEARDRLCHDPEGPCVVAASAAEAAFGHQERAFAYLRATYVAVGVGAAFAAGGLIWWLAAHGRRGDHPLVTFNLDAGGGFVGLQGRM